MKLLFLSNLYPTPWEPHRGLFNEGLTRALREAGHEVRCVVPIAWVDRLRAAWRGVRAGPADPQCAYPIWIYPPLVLRAWYDRFLWYAIRRTLRRMTRTWRPDAVLSFWVHPDAAVGLRFARELGVPGVAIAGGSDLLIITRDAARRRVISGVIRDADAVFTDGQHLREAAIALGGSPDRVHTFYRGVDAERFHPGDRAMARQRLGIAPGDRLLITIGNLVPVKGIDVLLDALAVAKGAWQLAILGDGSERGRLERRASKLGLSARVRFVGRVAHHDLPDWYLAADLVVLPSRSEGIPNVLLEALACGTPFVAAAVGGVPEIAPEPSFLFRSGDVAALAAALDRAHAHPVPPLSPRVFDWSATAARFTTVLQALAARQS